MARKMLSFRLWSLTCLSVAFLMIASSPLFAGKLKPTSFEITAFIKADKNKDRVLSKREFRTFVKMMASFGQSTAKTIRFFSAYSYAFSIVDKNKDGIVTPWEMRSADSNYRLKK